MSKYFSLLYDRKLEEAEKFRKSLVPNKLLKFVSLNDNPDNNSKKLLSLKNRQAWFSSINVLNDPYEFKCMYIDENKLKEHGYDEHIILKFKELLDNQVKQWSVLSLSAASLDCLPMWAYYTNNFSGFCVEYEVERPDAIFAVSYEPNRVPIATTIANLYLEFCKMIKRGEETNSEVEFYSTILRCQLHSKHESWKHEREYRILFPSQADIGFNVDIQNIGLKTSKIVAGLNCSKENKERLNDISNFLGCGDVLEAKISGNSYTLFER